MNNKRESIPLLENPIVRIHKQSMSTAVCHVTDAILLRVCIKIASYSTAELKHTVTCLSDYRRGMDW
jgi:hypothetical protein